MDGDGPTIGKHPKLKTSREPPTLVFCERAQVISLRPKALVDSGYTSVSRAWHEFQSSILGRLLRRIAARLCCCVAVCYPDKLATLEVAQ